MAAALSPLLRRLTSTAVHHARTLLLSSSHFNQSIHPPPHTLQSRFRSSYPESSNSETLDSPSAAPLPRTRTPLEKQFETWVDKLKPGFTPREVVEALRAQTDPDLALDIFRWTAQQRGYKHNHATYLTIIHILISGGRYGHAERVAEEVIAGASDASVPLYNTIIRFCIGRKVLWKRAFDVYKKMLKSDDCKPTLETYSMLFTFLLKRFNKLNVSYLLLHSVRSLVRQMKASGVVPDTYALNMIIKAYAACLEVDEAMRVFREMGLYGCEPNAFSYSYIAKALCTKGRAEEGFGFYKEMREKGLVPTSSTFMVLICSLAMEGLFEDAVGVTFDMLGKSMVPDVLTYKTLLGGFCRDGRGNEALELLEELRRRDGAMNSKVYRTLLDEVHFVTR
uniref:Pentatricopeptide repeat-containing protein n=1 Tax=Kalanchoe fedtschenkoi TaxID=63787 RepID=A0A7N0U947_KALFE